jgi:hypothetical protein
MCVGGELMANQWRQEEQIHILNSVPSYRQKIHLKNNKEAKRLTLEVAYYIHQHYPSVQNRTVNAIYERLPYIDNLLGGVFEIHHYAKKDQHLYSTLLREDKSKEPNLCNTRHNYNGALKEYLQNKD